MSTTLDPLDRLIAEAAATLIQAAASATGPLCIAFSAGKDSIVAAHLAHEVLGTTHAVCDNSFWFIRHQQDAEMSARQIGLTVAYVDRFGWSFLFKNPSWLFRPEKKQSPLFGQRQQKTVKDYARHGQYDGVIYGRRTQENSVPGPYYRTTEGQLQIHPLRDWKHEHIWAYIERHQLYVPSIYRHEIGQKDGSTPTVFMAPEKYDQPVWEVIRDFCPETYALMADKGLFVLYKTHPKSHGRT